MVISNSHRTICCLAQPTVVNEIESVSMKNSDQLAIDGEVVKLGDPKQPLLLLRTGPGVPYKMSRAMMDANAGMHPSPVGKT